MQSYHQIIVLAALLCVGLVAGNSISVPVHESVQLPSGISVRIESIQDSRCPATVQCIWAGLVQVKVILTQFRNSETVSLVLQPGQQLNTAQVTLGASAYKVTLQSVSPYPGSGSNQVPTATLQVTSV